MHINTNLWQLINEFPLVIYMYDNIARTIFGNDNWIYKYKNLYTDENGIIYISTFNKAHNVNYII